MTRRKPTIPKPKRRRKPTKALPLNRRKRPQKKRIGRDRRKQLLVAALRSWLRENPRVLSALLWEAAEGVRDFESWTTAERNELFEAYWRLEKRLPLQLAEPAPNALTPGDDEYAATALAATHAWPLYIAHVANCLHAEIRNRVSWRIGGAPSEVLTRLFDSRSMFQRYTAGPASGLYVLVENAVFGLGGWVVPCPPDLVRTFIDENALLGADRMETIGRVLEWSRQNLAHYSGSSNTANMERHWQYRGLPPVSRIISGTVVTDSAYTTMRHWTAGCHGTNGFLAAVLRTVNIPVDYMRPANVGHATPKFLWDARYLSHGDDPYNQFSQSASYPASELLIDEAKFAEWFEPGTTSANERNNNIGRRVHELALLHLPTTLLQMHCNDVAAGRTHSGSVVAAAFSSWYSVADLEAMALWQRLDARVAALGGCAYVP